MITEKLFFPHSHLFAKNAAFEGFLCQPSVGAVFVLS